MACVTTRYYFHETAQHGFFTHAVFARHDTAVLSPLEWRPMRSPRWLRVPNFHQFGGVNDRFAFGDNETMLRGYVHLCKQALRRGQKTRSTRPRRAPSAARRAPARPPAARACR